MMTVRRLMGRASTMKNTNNSLQRLRWFSLTMAAAHVISAMTARLHGSIEATTEDRIPNRTE
jgi:hypothetical protein